MGWDFARSLGARVIQGTSVSAAKPCLAAHFPQLFAKMTPLGRFTPRRGCIMYEAEEENFHLSAPKAGF